ncbi:MAG: hypothetical protein U1D31_00600 [Patescibacteria group bacterium]|nr:hypothetical protein [Patescibacteria group bacterium]
MIIRKSWAEKKKNITTANYTLYSWTGWYLFGIPLYKIRVTISANVA